MKIELSKTKKRINLNFDYDISLVEQYNVKSVPTTIILENGTEIKRHVRVLSGEQLNNLIK